MLVILKKKKSVCFAFISKMSALQFQKQKYFNQGITQTKHILLFISEKLFSHQKLIMKIFHDKIQSFHL